MKRHTLIFFSAFFTALAYSQDSVTPASRKYIHVGGIEHWSKDKLKLKSNGKYKIRHTTAQFRPIIKRGQWKISGDTLILTQEILCEKKGVLKKANRKALTEIKKFKISTRGLFIYYENGTISDEIYFK